MDKISIRRGLVVAVMLAAGLAACGGGGSPAPAASSGVATAAPSGAPASAAPAGNGKVDCAAVKGAAQQLLKVQFLAQLKTPDTIEQIKAKQIGNLDLDTFLASMDALHALDAYTSPLGDVKAAIDAYEAAGKAAQVLFAVEPITQAAIDTYNQEVGPRAAFIRHAPTILAAMDAAGC